MTTVAPTPGGPDNRPHDATLDAAEVERFGRLAAEWWDANGKFRPLHQLGPARLGVIRAEAVAHFGRDGPILVRRGLKPLAGLTVLDIGCGGGLVAEPMARMGGIVTGLDPAPENIAAARRHAAGQGLAIDYRAGRAEELAAAGLTYDLVLCLEVVEHVPEPAPFIALCASLVRPGGLLVLSTINRTVKAYALAILGAEYVLRWLPVGTHQWERFVTPDELARHARAAGLQPGAPRGLVYSPLADRWSEGTDTDVNYMLAAGR